MTDTETAFLPHASVRPSLKEEEGSDFLKLKAYLNEGTLNSPRGQTLTPHLFCHGDSVFNQLF